MSFYTFDIWRQFRKPDRVDRSIIWHNVSVLGARGEYLTETKSKISFFCDTNIIGHHNQMDQSENFTVSILCGGFG